MKIAFILPSLANKGPILVCKDIICNIYDNLDQCIVYYFDDIIEVSFPCEVKQISFFTLINFDQYDIIHTHMFRPDTFIWMQGLFRRRKFKSISTIHTAIYEDLNFAYSKLKALLLPPIWKMSWNSFDQIVVLTEHAKKYYSDLKGPITVISNGRSITEKSIDESDLKIINEIKTKYKVLGTVASFDERKGLRQIVQALVHLEDFCFVIIGDGTKVFKNSLIELSKEINVTDRLLFLGKKNQGDRYIPHFDIFVIPSISEGFPLAILEAMGHKTPIVCSNIPVFNEAFSSNEVSFFKLFDIKSLINAVDYAQRNGENLSKNAFIKYAENYTPAIMGVRYLKLYQHMMKNQKEQVYD
nr:glycosyltransferase family 4 protein [Pedobacter panaciterrae]